MAVPVRTGPGPVFESGARAPLFAFPVITIVPQSNVFAYGVAADGQRFLASVLAYAGSPTLNVIVNWTSTTPDVVCRLWLVRVAQPPSAVQGTGR
jgi:hypothetical protein